MKSNPAFDFWSAGLPASRLNYFRFFFALSCLYYYWSIPWEFYADVPPHLWRPPGLGRLLIPFSLNINSIRLVAGLFKLSLLSLSVGFISRFSAFLCVIFSLVLFGSYHSAFYFDHSANAVILTLMILTLSPTLGCNFSVDQVISKLRNNNFKVGEGVWPQYLIRFIFFSTFFAAGISKLVKSGWDWTDGQNMKSILLFAESAFRNQKLYEFQDTFHNFIYRTDWVTSSLGLITVAIELFCLPFFLYRKNSLFGVWLLFALQTGIFLTLYFSFSFFSPMYLIFIPWEALLSRFDRTEK